MKGKEFKDYLKAEMIEMENYANNHPELAREKAIGEWIKKYAAKFREKWKK